MLHKELFTACLGLLAVAISGYCVGYAMDKEFTNEYAKSIGVPSHWVRAVDSEKECLEDEYFEDKYGLCIALDRALTDSEVQ